MSKKMRTKENARVPIPKLDVEELWQEFSTAYLDKKHPWNKQPNEFINDKSTIYSANNKKEQLALAYDFVFGNETIEEFLSKHLSAQLDAEEKNKQFEQIKNDINQVLYRVNENLVRCKELDNPNAYTEAYSHVHALNRALKEKIANKWVAYRDKHIPRKRESDENLEEREAIIKSMLGRLCMTVLYSLCDHSITCATHSALESKKLARFIPCSEQRIIEVDRTAYELFLTTMFMHTANQNERTNTAHFNTHLLGNLAHLSQVACRKTAQEKREKPFSGIGKVDSKFEDRIRDKTQPVDAQLIASDYINQALDTLEGREKHIIIMRFGLNDNNPMTLKETGKELGITKERVRQIEAVALEKLSLAMNQPTSSLIEINGKSAASSRSRHH